MKKKIPDFGSDGNVKGYTYQEFPDSIYQLSTGDYIDLSLIASIGAANEFPESEIYQIPVILLHSYEPLYITGPKEVFQELVDAWKKFKGEL